MSRRAATTRARETRHRSCVGSPSAPSRVTTPGSAAREMRAETRPDARGTTKRTTTTTTRERAVPRRERAPGRRTADGGSARRRRRRRRRRGWEPASSRGRALRARARTRLPSTARVETTTTAPWRRATPARIPGSTYMYDACGTLSPLNCETSQRSRWARWARWARAASEPARRPPSDGAQCAREGRSSPRGGRREGGRRRPRSLTHHRVLT